MFVAISSRVTTDLLGLWFGPSGGEEAWSLSAVEKANWGVGYVGILSSGTVYLASASLWPIWERFLSLHCIGLMSQCFKNIFFVQVDLLEPRIPSLFRAPYLLSNVFQFLA